MLVGAALELSTQSGFDRALTQNREHVDDLIDVVWTWHVIRGLSLTVLLAAVAPWVAELYAEPALLPLMLVLSPCALLRGLHNTSVVLLARRLDFRRQVLLRVASTVGAAAVTVAAVVLWRSAWGLCVRAVTGVAISLVVSFVIIPHRPQLVWDWDRLRQLVAYGRWVTGSALLVFLVTQCDDLFVSKYLGPVALGFYQLAFRIASAPATHFAQVLSRAAFPSLARLQDSRGELERIFSALLRAVLFVSTAALSIAVVAAEPLVELAFGPAWRPVAPLLRILSALGVLRGAAMVGSVLFQAVGRPEIEFRLNWPRLVLTLALMWPLAAYLGLPGVCVSVVVALVPTLLLLVQALVRELGWNARDLVAVAGFPLASAAILAVTLVIALHSVPATLAGEAAGVVLGVSGWAALLGLLGRCTSWNARAELARVVALLRPLP